MRVTGLPPERIAIELTEHAQVSDSAVATIVRLRARGFRMALDDTGSANAGLVTLATAPLDIVKIDGGLLANMPSDERASAVLSGIVVLAQGLGCDVVLEGVETEVNSPPPARSRSAWGTPARSCARATHSVDPGPFRRRSPEVHPLLLTEFFCGGRIAT